MELNAHGNNITLHRALEISNKWYAGKSGLYDFVITGRVWNDKHRNQILDEIQREIRWLEVVSSGLNHDNPWHNELTSLNSLHAFITVIQTETETETEKARYGSNGAII